MIRVGSRSFYFASLLLPEGIRDGAYALYGFCRLSDDVVDIEGGRADAIERLRNRLDRVYAGRPAPDPVERTLADTINRFGVPRVLLDALLDGLVWDAEGRRYETLAEVLAYAARVAGSVGGMMAVLMGAHSAALVARACDLGVAMQLTNIARDVGEDARAGRLYLPRVWLREVGIDPEAFLLAPTFSPELANVVARLLRYADDLYRRADRGIANLDPACRPAIFAARHLYSEIGAEVGRRGLDSVSGRASVPTWRKLALLARAVRQAARSTTVEAAGLPLEETRYLVEAVVKDRHGSAPFVRRSKRGVEEDVAWLVNLFADLDGRLGAEVPPR